ncbi:Mrr_cat domain-containing protein [Rhodovastum atsumiense]|uniref:Restriction endonuclease type IV Mrr domain-containing protein n=1 Tax=Rhodovastum atsumiense TaxID=504468 RepID=A0A5M6IW65_9PROT|nr:restriction endonuclease [Rhodovastum atsumiense]KAA5612209.1 hypothetical protein F1189_11145 [Rhodovastum atsumiense]CAH2603831.1 Mrr_cat domain-containing protein [Rhodovastum atsumiense]
MLAATPPKIDGAFLLQFAEFQAFQSRTKSHDAPAAAEGTSAPTPTPVEPTSTPEEQITTASLALTEVLRDALLARVLEASPTFFERLIIDLLLAMGYGGSQTDARQQLGGTGDGGVDGVIRHS